MCRGAQAECHQRNLRQSHQYVMMFPLKNLLRSQKSSHMQKIRSLGSHKTKYYPECWHLKPNHCSHQHLMPNYLLHS